MMKLDIFKFLRIWLSMWVYIGVCHTLITGLINKQIYEEIRIIRDTLVIKTRTKY
jgi:hypothetical protein